jgi:hypothetical protein
MNMQKTRVNHKRLWCLAIIGLLSVGILATSLIVHPAQGSDGWWDSSWRYRKKIAFDNGDISENLVNFPMPISFNSSQSDFWGHVKNDGSDVRFVDADDSTELNFEFEQWNYTASEMTAWVKIPQVDSGSTIDFVWIYYGNSAASFDSYFNSNNVWDSDYRAVWHLNQTDGNYNDATLNGNHLTTVFVASRTEAAKIGKSVAGFNGINNFLSAPNSPSLNMTDRLTVEEWVNTVNPSIEQNVVSKNGNGRGKGWSHELYNAYNVHIQNGEASPDMEITNTNAIASANMWYHVVWVWDSSATDKAKAYVNGVEQTTIGSMANWTDQDVPLYLGLSYGAGVPRYPFNGKIDEMRLSDSARSPQWIKACYSYESDQTKFNYAEEEESFWPTEIYVDPTQVNKTLSDVGSTFKVNVTIKIVNDLQGFDFNLTWNNAYLTLVQVDFTDNLDHVWGYGNWFLAYNKTDLGYYDLAAASTAASFTSLSPAPLATLTFQVKYASPAVTLLHFAMAKLSNSHYTAIPHVAKDGTYTFFFEERHALAVTNVITSKSGCQPMETVGKGYTCRINATVENQGAFEETFNVTAYANETNVESKKITMASMSTTVVVFSWNVTAYAYGNYSISAVADTVPGELETADNNFTDGIIRVCLAGDVNGDGKVDLKDVYAVGKAFGSTRQGPNPPGRVYSPNLDINDDDKIDLKDYYTTCKNYGKTEP